MHRAFVIAGFALASLLLAPERIRANILIDFENTPAGVFSSYTDQGVTFTTLAPGMFLTSELFGNAPNGTRGLIGVPDLAEHSQDTSSLLLPEFPEFPELPPPPTGELPPVPSPDDPVPAGFFPAIQAEFDFVADFVCVDLGDDWQDDDAIFMTAYGENGQMIAHVSGFPGADPGDMRTLWILNPGIHSVVFGSTSPSEEGSSVFADHFCAREQVQAIPEWEGTVMLMMVLGLAAAACISAKRRLRSSQCQA